MDVCIVLGGNEILPGIEKDKYRNMYWGPNGVTGASYEELANSWPSENPTLPTKQAMIDYWAIMNS